MILPLSKKESEGGTLHFTSPVSSFPSIILFGKKTEWLGPMFLNYGWYARCHCWSFEPTNLFKVYNTFKCEYCWLCLFRGRNWGTSRQLSDGPITSQRRLWISIQYSDSDTQIFHFSGWWRIWGDNEVGQKQVPMCTQSKPAHSHSRPLLALDLMIQNELERQIISLSYNYSSWLCEKVVCLEETNAHTGWVRLKIAYLSIAQAGIVGYSRRWREVSSSTFQIFQENSKHMVSMSFFT